MQDIPSLIPNAPLRELVLPFPKQPIALLVLRDPWSTLAAAGADDPQQDVYWGELWPAGVALADAIFDGTVELAAGAGPILEVGCGTGLVSVAAAVMGGASVQVLATDREPRALLLTQENARRNGVAAHVQAVPVDWNAAYAGAHGLVFAADCLYRADATWQLAGFLRRALCDSPPARARAIVVDPDRLTARNFSFVARDAGFRVRTFKRAIPFITTHGPFRDAPGLSPAASALGPPEATFYELTFP